VTSLNKLQVAAKVVYETEFNFLFKPNKIQLIPIAQFHKTAYHHVSQNRGRKSEV